MKNTESLFNKLTESLWHTDIWSRVQGMENYQVECDDREGTLAVVIDHQGDAHLKVWPTERTTYGMSPTFRARTFAGGGRNERTRIALILLALAIKEDGEEMAATGGSLF
jgi:hypothetical protein